VILILLGAAACDEGNADTDAATDADATDADADTTDAGPDVPPLAVTTETLPAGRVRIDYAGRLEAGPSDEPPTWEITGGELPPGLALAPNGDIAGSPERSGEYAFEATARDGGRTASASLSITVVRVLLLSGFEPFGEFAINSSVEAIRPFDGMIVSGLDVRLAELPVVWGDAWDVLAAEIDRLHPDAVIATGQAGPEGMRFETMGRNVMIGTDNDGVTMEGAAIVEGGPFRLRAVYPIDEMREAMIAGGFPTLTSDNAGDFLCNYVFYRLLDFVASAAEPPAAAGFIHVPPSPAPGAMTIEEMTAAHRLGIEALAAWLETGERARIVTPDVHSAPRYYPPFR
jgi:pyroglutamyl-peptidase